MANIFSNFSNKVGNAFTNLGQGGNLFNANPVQIAALSDEDRKRLKQEGLQKFANSLGVAAAIGSGDPQRIALAQNKIRQTKIDKEDAKRKAQLQKDQEEFIKNNPDKANMIRMNQLFGFTPPAAKNRESYVAKDGYRYFVDGNNERVFPEITVKEEQSEADIYKENAARIKNIVLKEGIDSPKLTTQEKDFYINNINKQGVMSFDQSLGQIFLNQDGQNNQTKNYKVTNNSYGSMTANEIINQAMELNQGSTKEDVIQNLIANNIIAE